VPLLFTWIVTDPMDTRYGDLVGSLFLVTVILLPVSALVAILRYRLYEIDRIVNRTVLYGAMTALLAGLVAALVTFTQRGFLAATGATSDIAVVLIALATTAAYTPIRKRLEAIVDRHIKWESPLEPFRTELERTVALVDAEAAIRRLLVEGTSALSPTWAEARVRSGRGWRVVERRGSPGREPALTLSVHDEDRAIAQLLLGPPTAADGFPERELAELRVIADLLGRTVRRVPVEGE
jgi:type IV secretory pathway TrbD component